MPHQLEAARKADAVALRAAGAFPEETADRPLPSALLPAALSLRLALRSRPLSAARRLLLAAGSAATGYLLLACLGDAADGTWQSSTALVRLAWCLVPVGVVTLLAVAVGRAETAEASTAGLDSAGFGRARLPLLVAPQVAQAAVLGSAVALVVFVYHREEDTSPAPLPWAGLTTLLLVLPLVCSLACLTTLRPRRFPDWVRPAVAGTGLAAVTAGVLLVRLTPAPAHGGWPLPGSLGHIAPAALTGWLLALLGLPAVAPGLLALTGILLAVLRPGAVRLLAGRSLRAEAGRLGAGAGLAAATVCAAWGAHTARQHATRPAGHLTVLAAAVVVIGVLALLAGTTVGIHRTRTSTTGVLRSLGACGHHLNGVALLRAAVVVAVCLPPTAVVAWLTVPTTHR